MLLPKGNYFVLCVLKVHIPFRKKGEMIMWDRLNGSLSVRLICHLQMSDEETSRQLERRRRNKEAAEKSRKKRKEEFEKLQSVSTNEQTHYIKIKRV